MNTSNVLSAIIGIMLGWFGPELMDRTSEFGGRFSKWLLLFLIYTLGIVVDSLG